jgi:hypothetical protein
MSANRRGRKQRKHKDAEVASTSSTEERGAKYVEVYDEFAHNMEMSWNSMCESKNDIYPSARARLTQGYNTPSQGKPAGA